MFNYLATHSFSIPHHAFRMGASSYLRMSNCKDPRYLLFFSIFLSTMWTLVQCCGAFFLMNITDKSQEENNPADSQGFSRA